MLILSRNTGESINIGDDIEVVVLAIKGNQVRLGIAAPVEIPVHREEIYQRIQEEKKQKTQKLNSSNEKPFLGFLRKSHA